jgi:hypothetical protein
MLTYNRAMNGITIYVDWAYFLGIFGLDARLALTAEELALVRKYGFGSWIVYDSTARKKHDDARKAHLESTKEHPSVFADANTQLMGVGKTFFRLGRAVFSATRAALSLRITFDKLIQGTNIECEDMFELLDAEKAIKEGGWSASSAARAPQAARRQPRRRRGT